MFVTSLEKCRVVNTDYKDAKRQSPLLTFLPGNAILYIESVTPPGGRCPCLAVTRHGLYFYLSMVNQELYVNLKVMPLGGGRNCYMPVALPLFVNRPYDRVVDVNPIAPRITAGRQYYRPHRLSSLIRRYHRKSWLSRRTRTCMTL